MKRTFKGRNIAAGHAQAKALVTHQGFNTLASLKSVGSFINPKSIIEDQNNPELYGKQIPGTALCLPELIGSTTGGMVIYSVCSLGKGPACMLFSKPADSLAVAGAVLTANWSDYKMPVVDSLGEEFLDFVKEGMEITVEEDGTVIVEDGSDE